MWWLELVTKTKAHQSCIDCGATVARHSPRVGAAGPLADWLATPTQLRAALRVGSGETTPLLTVKCSVAAAVRAAERGATAAPTGVLRHYARSSWVPAVRNAHAPAI